MNRTRLLIVFFTALALFLCTSCEKEEGIGGTSSISGKIFVRQYNSNFTILTEKYYATNEDVFIIYGNEQIYGDKTSTTYDGTYRFDYLREGKYTIYAYSEDSANYPTQHEIPVIIEIEISGKNKEIVAEDIVILK
jgi:hypothetical protein